MRKSSAPSSLANTKKRRFTVPYAKNSGCPDSAASVFSSSSSSENIATGQASVCIQKPCDLVCNTPPSIRCTEDILKFIMDPGDSIDNQKQDCYKPISSEKTAMPANVLYHPPKLKYAASNPSNGGSSTVEHSPEEIYRMNLPKNAVSERPLYYSVLWCKRSMKKHKNWEGDAILIIRGKSAVLKDLEGKEIGRTLGYKSKEVTGLEEGSKFFIGGKECEIQSKIEEKDYMSGACFLSPNVLPSPSVSCIVKKHNNSVCCPVFKKPQVSLSSKNSCPKDDSAFYMPYPTAVHQWNFNKEHLPVVDVKVDFHLSQHLRSHQKQGVTFLYECILGFRNCQYQGCILGDQMGLGKTLQCITLIWTLYRQGPYAGRPILKRVLVITPSSLVKNWQAEFFKWLGKERMSIFAVGQDKKIKDFLCSKHTVLIISYEMYVRHAEMLSSTQFDLVICDEGHRLKNLNIRTSSVITNLRTKRRILLTGTPIQNDLQEFYSLAEFVNPGILGTMSQFKKIYEEPIVLSQNPNCSDEEKKLGESRASQLSNLTASFFLRRTQEVINQYLPPKAEIIVFCQPTNIQETLYKHLLKSRDVKTCLSSDSSNNGNLHLMCIMALKKLCNHPSLLYRCAATSTHEEFENVSMIVEHMKSAFPSDYTYMPNHSGKMKVLEHLLSYMVKSGSGEKIVLASSFIQTLDLMEKLCKAYGYNYLRLDGSINSSTRIELVNEFNSPHSKYSVFLLSSKAGGVGLNLIGASRILLYDIDWNPANDLQTMSRVWRDGQKRPVYVYRLLTTGTIEEKIYQRQIAKQGLSGTIIDTNHPSKVQFTREDLKDLFTFHDNVSCQTHDTIKCPCLHPDYKEDEDSTNKGNSGGTPWQLGWVQKSSHEKNTSMGELLKWKHIKGPISEEKFPKSCLSNCEDVTFLFVNEVNSNSDKNGSS